MMIKVSINDTRQNWRKSLVSKIFVKIGQRSKILWAISCLIFHQKKYGGKKINLNTIYQNLIMNLEIFQFYFFKSIFDIVCRIGDRILQAKQRNWSWKDAKIFATYNLRNPPATKNIIIDSDERVNRHLPKNHAFLPLEKFLSGNEMKLIIKYQGFVNISSPKNKTTPGRFNIQEIYSLKKGWCHIGCMGENFPSDTPSEIRYMLMCIPCRLKLSSGSDDFHLQLGVQEHITFLRDAKKYLKPCSIGSLQFLVKRQIHHYDARVTPKIERLTDKVIEALARGIVKNSYIRVEDKIHLDMLERIGRQISARATLKEIWIPTPITPTLTQKPIPSWDIGTSSSSDVSFSANDCSLSEIFPSPELSPVTVPDDEDSTDAEEPFFLRGSSRGLNKGSTKKNSQKGVKRRRSTSDPGISKVIKSEPPSLEKLPVPKVSKANLVIGDDKNTNRMSKKGAETPKNTVLRKSLEKKAEATQSDFGTLRSALCTKRKREWTLDEILVLKGEAQEIVREVARKTLDSTASASDRKALGVLINFD